MNLHAIQFHENTPTRVITWELMDGRMEDQTDTTEIIFAIAQASKIKFSRLLTALLLEVENSFLEIVNTATKIVILG